MPHTRFSAVSHARDTVEVHWSDGASDRFHAIWLRDHCHCEDCRNPNNGQRFLDVSQLPAALTVEAAEIDADGQLALRFGPEQHRSRYSPERLRDYLQQVQHQPHDRCEQDKTLWDAERLADAELRFDWGALCADAETLRRALQSFDQWGFFVATDSPAVAGQVLEVIRRFGHVRETNYGELFDVMAVVDPNNLAYSNVGLGAHADNPYREPVPTIQALHCIENNVDGGESLLLDGFMAADLLRREAPEHFDTLARTPLHFRFSDRGADLRSRVPLISVDERGRITCVRYNNRSVDTLAIPQAQVPAFYAAYRHYAEILTRPELNTTFKLDSGDCVVFDNTRVMHARTAFSTSGRRHLQGAYGDLDGLYSTMRVLEREAQA